MAEPVVPVAPTTATVRLFDMAVDSRNGDYERYSDLMSSECTLDPPEMAHVKKLHILLVRARLLQIPVGISKVTHAKCALAYK